MFWSLVAAAMAYFVYRCSTLAVRVTETEVTVRNILRTSSYPKDEVTHQKKEFYLYRWSTLQLKTEAKRHFITASFGLKWSFIGLESDPFVEDVLGQPRG